MGIENFNPAVWSAKLFVRLQKALIFANLVNQDYEGEIKEFGDQVRINEVGDVTINDYTKYTAITWQELEGAQKILFIDQAKTFSFTIDDIDTAQNKPNIMNGVMQNAAYRVADTVDTFLAGLYTGAGVTNTANLGTASSGVSVSSGNVIEKVTYVARYMDESNVPTEGRVAVVTPWFHQKLLLAEVGGIGATAVPKVGEAGTFIKGYVGEALGFRFYKSNNITNSSTTYRQMFFNRSAISYAGQVAKMRAVEREDYFDAGVKGLYVYGGKVVRPDSLAVLNAIEASG